MDSEKHLKVTIDDKGNYIVPYEIMDGILKALDDLSEKAGVATFAEWCCYARPETETDGECAKRGYREASKEIATIKCQLWVAKNYPSCIHDLERGHCPE